MNEQEIFERMTSVEQSVKSAHHRIDEVVENGKSIGEILVEMKYMRRDLNELLEGSCYRKKAKPQIRYDYNRNNHSRNRRGSQLFCQITFPNIIYGKDGEINENISRNNRTYSLFVSCAH